MSKLQELLERVEKATGTDRELDRDIADLLDPKLKLVWFATGVSEMDGDEVWLGETMEGGGPWSQWGSKACRKTFRSEKRVRDHLKYAMGAYKHPAAGGARVVSERIDVAAAFTASIDAAVGLVERMLPGCWVDLCGPRKYLHIPTPSPNHWRGMINAWNAQRDVVGWGATPALALIAALLSAMIAQEKE